jgi:hypothetical protein
VARCMRADGVLEGGEVGTEGVEQRRGQRVEVEPEVQRYAVHLATDAELTARDVVNAQLRAPALGADLCAAAGTSPRAQHVMVSKGGGHINTRGWLRGQRNTRADDVREQY